MQLEHTPAIATSKRQGKGEGGEYGWVGGGKGEKGSTGDGGEC